MFLFWRVRYLDSKTKEFNDRDLWLITEELDPVTRAAVEACHEMSRPGNSRGMLRFRHLFHEHKEESYKAFDEMCRKYGSMGGVSVDDYFEDERGQELTRQRMAVVLTGNPNAVMLPSGFKQHDLDYMFSEKAAIAIDALRLTPKQLFVPAYFVRDLHELESSALFKEGPGTLHRGGGPPELHTAVSDAEIRSFVTIFRRLYMEKEPAGFLKAVKVFEEVLQGHPLGRWVMGVAGEYTQALDRPPQYIPMLIRGSTPFSVKRLIDVFLYTQYAHQPDANRTGQFQECVAAVQNEHAVLTWLFLTEMWKCSITIRNAGTRIAKFFDAYCIHHQPQCGVLNSVVAENPKIGTLETKEAQRKRVLEEKATEIATAMWEAAGRPPGGIQQFIADAMSQLRSHFPDATG